mmetsp:Transcript_33505/g.65990  ORF Transcript_33505/g.65990 Transcript_33505/m.65990 type:complete len:87 (-) Transcript_33505:803-1063(-)
MKDTTPFGDCDQKPFRLFSANAFHLQLLLCVESAPTSMSARGLLLIFRRSQYQGHCAREVLLLIEIVSGLCVSSMLFPLLLRRSLC